MYYSCGSSSQRGSPQYLPRRITTHSKVTTRTPPYGLGRGLEIVSRTAIKAIRPAASIKAGIGEAAVGFRELDIKVAVVTITEAMTTLIGEAFVVEEA